MADIEYEVRGFLTVRRDSLRVPLRGSLTVHADPGSGHFTGNLVLRPAAIGRRIFGVGLFGATVRIDAESLVDGRVEGVAAEVLRDVIGRLGEERQPAPRRRGGVVVGAAGSTRRR